MSEMKNKVMRTVHVLLKHSGQTFKHLATDSRSIEIYDVEHWPDSFNSLLLHDFPSLSISVDSSATSLSGFVVTLQWNPVMDISARASAVLHIVVVSVFICIMLSACYRGFQTISVTEMAQIKNDYVSTGSRGENASTSSLAAQLRVLMAHSEL
jgi:hypothetical protein